MDAKIIKFPTKETERKNELIVKINMDATVPDWRAKVGAVFMAAGAALMGIGCIEVERD